MLSYKLGQVNNKNNTPRTLQFIFKQVQMKKLQNDPSIQFKLAQALKTVEILRI